MHLFFSYGVYETDLRCVKHQAVTLLSTVTIQPVTDNRSV